MQICISLRERAYRLENRKKVRKGKSFYNLCFKLRKNPDL
uniref:Uncharacterized protein n=1 Tax=Rhizophora mucronata TaxID=61149 RepID=A0A2P2KST8_RHIMU